MSRQTVISIENGHYLPSLPLAFAIARFFDLTVDKMFGPAEEEAGAPPRGKQAGRSQCLCSVTCTHGMSVGQHKPMLPHTARMSSAPCLVPIWSNATEFPNRLLAYVLTYGFPSCDLATVLRLLQSASAMSH